MANALAPMMPAPHKMALPSSGLQTPEYLSPTAPVPPPVAPRAMPNALRAPNAYMGAPKKPQNEMLGAAVRGFQRGFDPEGFEKQREQGKADGQEKAKQTLALMQQQRQLPEAQRTQWWQQNAATIGGIIGQDISQQQVDPAQFSDQALDGQIAALSGQLGIAPDKPDPMSAYQREQIRLEELKMQQPKKPIEINGRLVDPDTYEELYVAPDKPGDDIRQVGNQIVQRQQDGSWKPVYTGSTPAETARAFQGFIDQATGEQMIVMSNGAVQGTGRTAYVPPQITSVGGVPTAVDKRTLGTTELSPVEQVAGNKAAMASAEVQGKAQGQAAFDLPTIEMRSQAAIRSINDLRTRNIGTRFGLQSKLYAIPGTEGADVQALVNQVTSQAFLNAFDQLRGAGAITEREGQAATQAITRLQNQNITVAEAMQAMDELQRYYRSGLEVARQKAIKGPILPQAATTGQPQASAGRNASAPAMQLAVRAYAKQSNIPSDAITEFLSNPSTPEEIAEFNETFGTGQAEAILEAMQGGR